MGDSSPVKEGDVLAQKYRVDRVLGVGGMGVVVAATHLQLDRQVALKFMLPAAFADPDALARFQREARIAVKLSSEHVAKVLDTGTFDDGSPYIVMEYLEGKDLGEHLKAVGVMPVRNAADLLIQACDAVAEAHALGMVHRDLKPANLFVTRRRDNTPLVKVLDFGISKSSSLGEGNFAMTKTTSLMGSPLYMSPEQMRSAKKVDHRTDIWALGIILYELLGGRVPFNSDTLGDLLSKVMMDPPEPLLTIRPEVPRDVCDLVDRCLKKNVNERVQSVAEIARGLAPHASPYVQPIVERIESVLGGAKPDVVPPPAPSSASHIPQAFEQTAAVTDARTVSPWSRPATTPGSKRTGLIAAGAAVLVVGAAGAALFLAFRKSTPTTAVESAKPTTSTIAPHIDPAATPSATPTTPPVASTAIAPAVTTTPTPSVATVVPGVATTKKTIKTQPQPSASSSAAPKPNIFDTSN